MKLKALAVSLTLTVQFYSATATAQVPELDMPSCLLCGETSAKFFGGATADDGASYGSSFGYDEQVDLVGEIQVEAAHVNTAGNLYVIILWGEDYFMRNEEGGYDLWDSDPATLQPTISGKTLQSLEAINIIEDVAFGPAGVSDTSLSVFLAYDSMADVGDIFYSGVPLSFSIEAEVNDAASFSLYTQTISSQIIQSTCIVCHKAGLSAQNTPLLYVDSNQPDFQQTNFNTIMDYVQNNPNGASWILAKPQGQIAHDGGVLLSPTTSNGQNWIEFVESVLAL